LQDSQLKAPATGRLTVDRLTPQTEGFAMTRSLRPFTVSIAVGLVACSFLAAPAAQAAELSQTSGGYVVRYSPAELANSADAASVYRKLKFAAREACRSGATIRSLTERVQSDRCYEKLLASVVREIDQPMLTSLHEANIDKVS
jgi:UrcA family protein